MRKNQKKKIRIVFLTILVLCIVGSIWYVNDYYRSTPEVEEYFKKDGAVKITEIDEGLFLDGEGTEKAMIFYPGAKVEYTSYVPMLYRLAESGTDVFLVKMPCNLAIFGKNKAETILKEYQYDIWYLGGHSLGGAMAANYLAEHEKDNKISGLILLAAYPTKDLKTSNAKVLMLYGTNDGVLNREKVKEGRKYLPDDSVEIELTGGNHAKFGCYGKQKGDIVENADKEISAEEQWAKTVEVINQTMEVK